MNFRCVASFANTHGALSRRSMNSPQTVLLGVEPLGTAGLEFLQVSGLSESNVVIRTAITQVA
jgi:hypothetical protein